MSIYSFNKPQESEAKDPNEVDKVKVGEAPKAAIDKIGVQEGIKDEKAKVVVMDGPLSHVYTKALNEVLANESVMLVTASNDTTSTNQEANKETNPSFTGVMGEDAEYVYALGDKIIEDHVAMEAYNAISSAINSGKYKKIHLAFEGAMSGKMSKRVGSLMDSALKLGVKVVAKSKFGVDGAVASLSTNIRK